tara:strand:+ start:712 stop:927 length:216 start_codon:yes stop_codon:yes gene_type:complete
MTHSCPCGHDWFDNNGGGDCPKCGNNSMRIGHHYDEEHFDELPEEPEEDETYSQQMQDELEPIEEDEDEGY